MKRTAALILALVATAGAAQDPWPSRPVHIIVPYTPGTGADILARVLGPKLGERWKAAVVTDNKAGATGNIGADAAAKSSPDGYTLLLTATSFTTNPALKPAPFDPVKDFAPIALLATGGLGVYINPQVPAKNMREFITLVKSQPGKLYYSSPGNGGPQHLAMELLKLETGMDIVHVPYKGAAGAISDLVGGHVQAMVSALQTVAPHVQNGRLRMLAVMSAKRAEAFPEVPTLEQAGAPDLEVETWYAMFAPAGTPAAIVTRVNRDVNELLKESDVRDVLARQGLDPAGGTPEVLGQRVQRELANWTRVVKAAGIKAD
ncbi:MAG: tripartite tricarboxylate transporter substrate binding protein [Betaproteobacteria bacterium]|nr:tripartite tricarboxylate transporter substrate binding protein [Betaproteobacteria bacterium]